MITLFYHPIKDEYTLTEDGAEELLSRMAGDFLRDCASNNERLQNENKQLQEKVQNLYADYFKLSCSDVGLRDLISSIYRHFYGVVFENWSYTKQDFKMYASLMKELGVDTEIKNEE